MANDLRTITECRVCGLKNPERIFSLGELFVSNFLDDAEFKGLKKYPLELVLCNRKNGGCGLLQLRHTVSNEVMYRNYWYKSGTNQTMTDELYGVAVAAGERAALAPEDFVLDIGCNDGTLLRAYGKDGARRVGFEPARNLAPVARLNADKIINDFFNFEAWNKEFPGKKAKIITAIAMFYDLDEPNKFVADVAKCLDPNGIFVIQMSYLPLMLSKNAFDNICHEHLEYYSLLSLENLLSRHGLGVFDAELNDVNGGSFRIYIKHKDPAGNVKIPAGAEERLIKLRREENELGLNDAKVYGDFAKRALALKEKMSDFIKNEVERGKKVYVYGASTKGNTLLQFYGLDSGLIPFAAERNQDKWGKKTVGGLIPIISEEQARLDKPDYFLILPWHFLGEFKSREKNYLNNGGRFIVPLPELRIVGSEWRRAAE